MKNTTINDVVAFLDATFRPELQEDYDNAGFLLGDGKSLYRGSLVALDLTPAVIDEAVEQGLNLIVTHHPFIFGGLKRITDRTEAGRMVMTLVQNGISVYAAHTNLDNLPWGVNGILAEKLGLKDCKILCRQNAGAPYETGAGMVGELPEPMEVEAFLQKVKSLLGIPFIRVSPFTSHPSPLTLRRVALCGGAGSFLIGDAIAAGADLFLTADLKYHDFQRGGSSAPKGHLPSKGEEYRGMILADAGHYETEQFAKEIISRTISEKFCNFACRISERQKSIIQYI